MKSFLIPPILFLAVMLSGFSLSAQIAMEKSALIEEYGTAYSTGIDDQGKEYLTYDKELLSVEGDSITRTEIFYFVKYQDSTETPIEVCSHTKLIFPSSETPFYLIWLEDKMTNMGNLKWKDPNSRYSYKVQIIEPFFALTIFIDGEGVTETFKETESFSKNYYINLSRN